MDLTILQEGGAHPDKAACNQETQKSKRVKPQEVPEMSWGSRAALTHTEVQRSTLQSCLAC